MAPAVTNTSARLDSSAGERTPLHLLLVDAIREGHILPACDICAR